MGAGFGLLILSADFVDDLTDFLSTSVPESESDSTSSELLGFFGGLRCFFDVDDVADDTGVAAGDGTEDVRVFEDFSSLAAFSTSASLTG